MDDASTELLRYLGTQLPTRPWLTCTTRRPSEGGFLAAEGVPPLPALTLRLEPLPPDDAKLLIRAAAGSRSFRTRSWVQSSTEAQATHFSSESSRLRRRRARPGSSCRTPSRRSSPRASTGSLLQTARSCAGRLFSVRRSPGR